MSTLNFTSFAQYLSGKKAFFVWDIVSGIGGSHPALMCISCELCYLLFLVISPIFLSWWSHQLQFECVNSQTKLLESMHNLWPGYTHFQRTNEWVEFLCKLAHTYTSSRVRRHETFFWYKLLYPSLAEKLYLNLELMLSYAGTVRSGVAVLSCVWVYSTAT